MSCIFYRLRSVLRQERSITFPRDTRFFVTTSHQRYSSSLTCTSSGVSISLGLCLHTNKLAPERHFLPKNRLPSGWQSSVWQSFLLLNLSVCLLSLSTNPRSTLFPPFTKAGQRLIGLLCFVIFRQFTFPSLSIL